MKSIPERFPLRALNASTPFVKSPGPHGTRVSCMTNLRSAKSHRNNPRYLQRATTKSPLQGSSMINRFLLLTLLATTFANAQSSQPAAAPSPAKWPTQDGTYIIKNFRFNTGESLPELKLHYLTLG